MDDVPRNVTHEDPSLTAFDVERLLGGERLDRPDLDDLQAVLDALRAPASAGELSSEGAAVAAFVQATSTPHARRKPMLVRLVAGKAAAVAAIACVSLSGAAAYAGVLPPQLQTVAHDLINAPAPKTDDSVAKVAEADEQQTQQPTDEKTTESAKPTETETDSPDASETPKPLTSDSPQLFGLCTAYLAHHKHDDPTATATSSAPADDAEAFRQLSTLYSGDVAAQCQTVVDAKKGTATDSVAATSPGKSGDHSKHGQDEKAAHAHKGKGSQDQSESAKAEDSSQSSQASDHATEHPTEDPTTEATDGGDSHDGGSGQGD